MGGTVSSEVRICYPGGAQIPGPGVPEPREVAEEADA